MTSGYALRMRERHRGAERAAPGMHDQHHRPEPEFLQGFVDHLALDHRSRIRQPLARTPAMTGAINEDYSMVFGESLAERPAHDLQI
jgi:hypothetical protein